MLIPLAAYGLPVPWPLLHVRTTKKDKGENHMATGAWPDYLNCHRQLHISVGGQCKTVKSEQCARAWQLNEE